MFVLLFLLFIIAVGILIGDGLYRFAVWVYTPKAPVPPVPEIQMLGMDNYNGETTHYHPGNALQGLPEEMTVERLLPSGERHVKVWRGQIPPPEHLRKHHEMAEMILVSDEILPPLPQPPQPPCPPFRPYPDEH